MPSRVVLTPRLANTAAAMECRLRDRIQYDDADSIILIADVVQFYVRDDLLKNGKIETRELDPLSRLGGPNYAALGRFTTMGHTT